MPTTPTTVNSFIYLASQSPRRRQLLEQLGVAYQMLLPDGDEDAEALEQVLPNEAPAVYVQRVTQLKQQLDQARLQQQRVKLNQQQRKLNQQRATLVGKQ